jgi:hypothetical protein
MFKVGDKVTYKKPGQIVSVNINDGNIDYTVQMPDNEVITTKSNHLQNIDANEWENIDSNLTQTTHAFNHLNDKYRDYWKNLGINTGGKRKSRKHKNRKAKKSRKTRK